MKAIQDANNGIIDANLGGGVIKQRIARANEGKSGGYRSIILFKHEDRAFFVHGFAKSELANIDKQKEKELKLLAKLILPLGEKQISKLLEQGSFIEILEDRNG